MYSPNIYSYYLDFLEHDTKIKKIAYASSFGVDTWEYSDEQTRRCAELAKLFDAISVREQSGVDLCSKYLGVESECVLDPTLLLDKEDYLALIGDRYKGAQGEGVFTYFLDSNAEKERAAEQLAKKLNTHTYKCYANVSVSQPISADVNDYKMPPVEEWLASFANAEFVITDSFHGCVFSIIFKKPFIVFINKERGATRFESLLLKADNVKNMLRDPITLLDAEVTPCSYQVDVEVFFSEKEQAILFLNEMFSELK